MSNGDDQLGTQDDEGGTEPGEERPPSPPADTYPPDSLEDRDGKDSFPASDPPANY